MDDDQHQARTEGLGFALGRLSAAREMRGPVGVVDPFELTSDEQRAATELPRVAERRGLFRFSHRGRAAVAADLDDLDIAGVVN